jgi:hypothetical protein
MAAVFVEAARFWGGHLFNCCRINPSRYQGFSELKQPGAIVL